MESTNKPLDPRERQMWEIAERRVSFKNHLLSYLVVNAGLWALWFFSANDTHNGYPWPTWASIGWGIGLAFHFLSAYVLTEFGSVEKEYERLKKQRSM